MPRTLESSIDTFKRASLALFNSIQPKCIEDAIESKQLALVNIRRHIPEGDIRVRKFLAYCISDILKFFNLNRTASLDQINTAVDMILEDFYYFRIDDIKMIVGMAKRNQFGEIYGHIDGATIYSWFSKYNDMRVHAAINHTERKHNEITASEKRTTERYDKDIRK